MNGALVPDSGAQRRPDDRALASIGKLKLDLTPTIIYNLVA